MNGDSENLSLLFQENESGIQSKRLDKIPASEMGHLLNKVEAIDNHELGPYAIDRKYSGSGKYASELGEPPRGEKPSRTGDSNYNLPYLGLLHKDIDSDGASDSEGKTFVKRSLDSANLIVEQSQSRSPSIIFEDSPMAAEQESSTSPTTPSALKRKRSLSQPGNVEDSNSEQVNLGSEQRRVPPLINVSTKQIISCYPPDLQDVLVVPSWLTVNFTGDNQEFIDIGQLVTEQVVLKSTFADEESLSFGWDNFDYSAYNNTPVRDPLQGMVTHFFPHSKKIELGNSIIAPEQIVAAVQASKVPPKPPNRLGDPSKAIRRPNDKSESVYEISAPNVLAHRVDNLMELSSMALNFWEELGLAPCKGSKNIRAVCVIPRSEPMRRAVSSFHDAVTGFWQSMRLGSHTPLDKSDALSGGCLEVPFVGSDKKANYQSLAKACEDLGMLIILAFSSY